MSINLQIMGSVDLSQSVRDHVDSKIERLGNLAYGRSLATFVHFKKDGRDFVVSITHVLPQLHIFVQGRSDDIYVAADKSFDRLRKRIIKYKETREDMRDFDLPEEIFREEERPILECDFKGSNITKYRCHIAPKMPIEKALFNMDASGDAFLVFKDSDSNSLHIAYTSQGGVGLLKIL